MPELNQYQKAAVNTATPIELVLIVYDECLRSLGFAEEAFGIEGPERIEVIGNHILHAKDSITELAVSLDMEQGGEISKNLSRLYEFMSHSLSMANQKKEIGPVLEVKRMMAELREAWVLVAEQVPKMQAQAPAEPVNRGSGRYNFSG